MCQCEIEFQRKLRRRAFASTYQLKLAFPPSPPPESNLPIPRMVRRRDGVSLTLLERQPSRTPPGSWAKYMEFGPDWLAFYQAQWVRQRKADGLPHAIKKPHPRLQEFLAAEDPASLLVRKIHKFPPTRVAHSAGNAVPDPVCDQRRMTA